MNIHFGENYPFEPPFVRIVEPIIADGHVLDGGAMCMELLMTQGWSSVYTAEAVILQVAATIVTGKGRVNFQMVGVRNSLVKARNGFNYLLGIPDRGRMLWTHACYGLHDSLPAAFVRFISHFIFRMDFEV